MLDVRGAGVMSKALTMPRQDCFSIESWRTHKRIATLHDQCYSRGCRAVLQPRQHDEQGLKHGADPGVGHPPPQQQEQQSRHGAVAACQMQTHPQGQPQGRPAAACTTSLLKYGDY